MTMHDASSPANGNGHGHDPLQKRVEEGPRGGARTWYEVLDVAPDVSAADLRKAYDRSLALVEGRSIGGYLMLDPIGAEGARADVEAAFAVLGDPERRAAYDQLLRREEHGEAGREVDARTEVKGNAPRAAQTVDAQAQDVTPKPPPDAAPAIPEATSSPVPEAGSAPPRRGTPSPLRFLAPAAETAQPGAPASLVRFEAPQTWSGEEQRPPAEVGPPVAEEARPQPVEANGMLSAAESSEERPSPAVRDATTVVPMPSSAGPLRHVPARSADSSLPGPALPEGEINGDIIRELRIARGMTLDQVAEATKIRRPYLQAIEESDVPNLPGRVYLRGFLTQVARVLRVDRARLAEGYLQFVERVTGAR